MTVVCVRVYVVCMYPSGTSGRAEIQRHVRVVLTPNDDCLLHVTHDTANALNARASALVCTVAADALSELRKRV